MENQSKQLDQEQESKVPPTKEQIIEWYKQEIEMASLRAELSRHQRDAVVYEAERIQAIGAIAQMTQEPPKEQEQSEHIDTEPKKRVLRKEVSSDQY